VHFAANSWKPQLTLTRSMLLSQACLDAVWYDEAVLEVHFMRSDDSVWCGKAGSAANGVLRRGSVVVDAPRPSHHELMGQSTSKVAEEANGVGCIGATSILDGVGSKLWTISAASANGSPHPISHATDCLRSARTAPAPPPAETDSSDASSPSSNLLDTLS
jgi:hypothetical protein